MIAESAPAPARHASAQRGFTLLELLVVVAIAAILAALAAPSLRDFLGRSKMNSIGGDFTGSILRARNEAVGKNICVTMCMSNNVDAVGPSCYGSGTDWQVGWIAFLNPSCDPALNSPAADEDMLFIRRPITGDFYLQSQASTPTRKIQFSPRGISGLSSADEFWLIHSAINDPWTTKFGYSICLNKMGRTRTISSDASCGTDTN